MKHAVRPEHGSELLCIMSGWRERRQSAADKSENALEKAMRILVLTAAMITAATAALADTDNFDQAPTGSPPPNWTCGVTGQGSPVWKVETDPSAPSKPNVLKQSGSGTFPWCVRKDVSVADGYVEVKFKPLEGREDQAGGLVWRWKDGDNYYIARANALEEQCLDCITPKRAGDLQSRYVDAPVATNQWHIVARGIFRPTHQGPPGRQAIS